MLFVMLSIADITSAHRIVKSWFNCNTVSYTFLHHVLLVANDMSKVIVRWQLT